VRSSSKGNYVSVTARLRTNSSDEVLDVYDRAYEIDDVIAL
jgi:putative lipoic acid-binding regulatory protein